MGGEGLTYFPGVIAGGFHSARALHQAGTLYGCLLWGNEPGVLFVQKQGV